jgi:hypothetical protein
VKIQPQWVVTPGKQTNIYVVNESEFYVRSRVSEQQEADIEIKNVRR